MDPTELIFEVQKLESLGRKEEAYKLMREFIEDLGDYIEAEVESRIEIGD
jgi:hypothetical protein